MAAITCRLWMLSVACCLAAWPGARAGADVDGRPPSPGGDEAPPPQVYTAYPLAYTEDPASSMLVQAVASAEPPRVQLAQTPVETVQDSVQGTANELAALTLPQVARAPSGTALENILAELKKANG